MWKHSTQSVFLLGNISHNFNRNTLGDNFQKIMLSSDNAFLQWKFNVIKFKQKMENKFEKNECANCKEIFLVPSAYYVF